MPNSRSGGESIANRLDCLRWQRPTSLWGAHWIKRIDRKSRPPSAGCRSADKGGCVVFTEYPSGVICPSPETENLDRAILCDGEPGRLVSLPSGSMRARMLSGASSCLGVHAQNEPQVIQIRAAEKHP